MTSTLEKLDGLARKLSIQVPAEKVRDAFEKVYKGIQKNATIKGFRQGKAPIGAIKSMYSDAVKKDVLQDLIAESYQTAVDEHKLDPIGFPRVQFDHFSEDAHFQYTAELEIRPQIELKRYEGLKVEKEKYEITDANIDEVLTNLRDRHADLVPVLEDRGVAQGDVAQLDFEGFVNGTPFPGGKAENYELEIGGGQTIPGFEDGVIGMRVGDQRDVSVTFPADYHAKELAGQSAIFKMNLKGLKKRSLPELNDEFATKVGSKGTLADLRNEIRRDLEAGEERRIQDDLKNKILKALVQENPVQVPQSLLEKQIQGLEQDVRERMRQQGMQSDTEFEEYKQKWAGDFKETATFMVQSTFLIDALADKLNIRATAQDLSDRIDEHAKSIGIERARLDEFYQDRDRRSRLFFQITEEKVVKYLIEKANLS